MNAYSFLPVVIDCFVKGTLMLGLASLLAGAFRQRSAARRHLIWLAAFVGLLILPFTRMVPPRWTYRLLPQSQVASDGVLRPDLGSREILLDAARRSAEQLGSREGHAPVNDQKSASETYGGAAVPLAMTLWTVAKMIWLLGVMGLLGFAAAGRLRLEAIRKRGIEVDDVRFKNLVDRISGEVGVKTVEVRISGDCPVPCTWGVRRPVVLLPVEARSWDEERLTTVLRHELSHVRRGDYFSLMIVRIACALYWPSPFVWWAARSFQSAQEQACDDLVIRAGTNPEGYAMQLVEMVRLFTSSAQSATHGVGMARPSTLEQRVLALVDGQRDRRPASRSVRRAAALALATVLVTVSFAQVTTEPRPGNGSVRSSRSPQITAVEHEDDPSANITEPVKPKENAAPVNAASADVSVPSVSARPGWGIASDEIKVTSVKQTADNGWSAIINGVACSVGQNIRVNGGDLLRIIAINERSVTLQRERELAMIPVTAEPPTPAEKITEQSLVAASIERKFVEITQQNLTELSFDWLLGQTNVPGAKAPSGEPIVTLAALQGEISRLLIPGMRIKLRLGGEGAGQLEIDGLISDQTRDPRMDAEDFRVRLEGRIGHEFPGISVMFRAMGESVNAGECSFTLRVRQDAQATKRVDELFKRP